jgi:PAS domain-containing protein
MEEMGLFKKKQITEEEATVTMMPGTQYAGGPQDLSALVLKSIREGVIIVGADYNIKLANPMASVMLGRSTDELVGLNFDSGINFICDGNTGSKSSKCLAINCKCFVLFYKSKKI